MNEHDVQRQLAPLGAPPSAGKALTDFAKANGISLTDLFSHLPEILALLGSMKELFEKIFKKTP